MPVLYLMLSEAKHTFSHDLLKPVNERLASELRNFSTASLSECLIIAY